MSLVQSFVEEFQLSIKSRDTEEKLDLYFYRPFGFLIAKVANFFNMTPTMLSVFGLISGVVGGFCFLDPNNKINLIIGILLFILAGVFDSSDGQLARISGKSTPLGLILDGICDNIVFITIYLCAAYSFVDIYGPLIYLLAVLGGISHSFQSAILDFYHREYLYFGCGKCKDETYWNPGVDEAKKNILKAKTTKEKLFHRLRLSWIAQQNLLSGRSVSERLQMRSTLLSNKKDESVKFQTKYRLLNRPMLPFWRLLGPNFHTFSIIAFILCGRFDLYLLCIDLIFLNFVIVILRPIQRRRDEKLIKATLVKTTLIKATN
ncbi:MAG: CDP-alcohol phosphatidyltransferase family protein [Oligoflexia bacterium]|nr:CDP-alcohol phosphatidyltransferase family protein [Oligoflexia bacterium]